jgi:protein-disulfide isomerase
LLKKRNTRKTGNKGISLGISAVIVGALLLVVLATALYIYSPVAQATPARPTDLPEVRAIGPVNAPVTIIEYGDFGCPTCKGWYDSHTLQQLLAKYGNKIRFVWRDFPIITTQSPKAAEAGLCATDQGKFWEYHDALYNNFPATDVASLKKYAAKIGLDTVKFNHCLDSGKYEDLVNLETQDGYDAGFKATPSFKINGKSLVGPASLSEFSAIIDPILQSGG